MTTAPAWLLSVKPVADTNADAEADNPWVVRAATADLLTHPGSPEGQRRKTLCQLVGVHLARGDSPASITAMAQAWADRCMPPLPEWRKHVDGLLRREEAKSVSLGMTTSFSPSPAAAPEAGKEGNNSRAHAQAELFPSFPPSAVSGEPNGLSAEKPSAVAPGSGSGSGTRHEPVPSPEPKPGSGPHADWPTLPPDAYHGLLGDMLHAVSPHTEADPAGVLLGWLTCLGNIVGRAAWVQVGPRLHYPALYVGVVGRTSDAKGDGWAAALWPFRQIEPAWANGCIAHGVGSGEGLVERIADAQTVIDKKGNAQVIPGAADKRCLLRLSELSVCFKKGRRENATLSEHLREGWDGEPIHVPNRKGNALATSDYAVSVYGDITPGVVRKLLESGSEGFDGFANRFLWAAVKRSRFLPSGGSMEPLKPYLERLQTALAIAKKAGELTRDADAEALWTEVYPALCTSGDSVPHTDRARPCVVRLAMLYALADSSKVIKVEHLRAALAMWDYCRQSAKIIFCGQQTPGPEPLWLQLLNAIGNSPGIRRSELLRAFRSVSAQELDGLLSGLEAKGLAHRRMVEGSGRPAECWYPGHGRPGGDGDGESRVNDNHSSPSASASPWVVQADADAENVGKEGNITSAIKILTYSD